MLTLIVILIGLLVLFIVLRRKLYRITPDHTLMFTGAPGTGKTLKAVEMTLQLYSKVKRQVRKENRKIKLFNKFRKLKKPLQPKPLLLSNMPIRISRKEWSQDFKPEHAFLLESIGYKSVTFITELGKFARKHDWQNPYNNVNIDEFISLYRHYTKGGYFVCDDQSHSQIYIDIRERIGTVINMLHLRKFWKIYWVRMRNIHISEGITVVEDQMTEDAMKWHFGLFPLFRKRYDTYAFSERYKTVPPGTIKSHSHYKINRYLKVPQVRRDKHRNLTGTWLEPLTSDD